MSPGRFGINRIRQDCARLLYPIFEGIRNPSGPGGNRTAIGLVPACLCLMAACIGAGTYYETLNVGFLLDDYYHLAYLIKAFHGDFSGLVRLLTGSWSGPTGLNSFRPLTSLGLVLDFGLWKTNARGYHLSNLALYAGCCAGLLVLMLQLLDGAGRIRYPAAFTASILFAVYPIHPESVAWVVGRVDVQCTFFFLLSLICYFRFRATGRGSMLILSLLFFLASVASKEMAVVLPPVVLSAEYLLSRDLGWTKPKVPLLFPAAYFVLLGVFAAVRANAIGELVGGYGPAGVASLSGGFVRFLDLATAGKIVFGVNEERPLQFGMFPYAAAAFLACLLPCFIARPAARIRRVAGFLTIWIAISVLPAYQIWHVYPNLVGSRLFFLGSAPLCALLSIGAMVPFFDAASRADMTARGLRFVTPGALTVMLVSWSVAVHSNIQVWRQAGEAMRGIRAQIQSLYRSIPDGRHIHLVDLPQDHSGAGLIGRPAYMRTMLSRPLADRDYAARIVTTELELSNAREFIFPSLVHRAALDQATALSLRWSPVDRRYEPWSVPEDPTIPGPRVTAPKPRYTEFSKKADILWFRTGGLNPFASGWIKLELKVSQQDGASTAAPAAQLRMVFRSLNQPPGWIDYSIGPPPLSSTVVQGRGRESDAKDPNTMTMEYFFVPYRHRSWALNGPVREIGFELSAPAPGRVEQASLEVGGPDQIFPRIELPIEPVDRRPGGPGTGSTCRVAVKFDAAAIPGARGVELFVGRSGTPIALSVTRHAPDESALVLERSIMLTRGVVTLPPRIAGSSPGLHEVAILAVDDQGTPVGFLSEPGYFTGCPWQAGTKR